MPKKSTDYVMIFCHFLGKSLDIVLKKVKHKMVENMSSSTADALGLSR